jgi:hypothetical protein
MGGLGPNPSASDSALIASGLEAGRRSIRRGGGGLAGPPPPAWRPGTWENSAAAVGAGSEVPIEELSRESCAGSAGM